MAEFTLRAQDQHGNVAFVDVCGRDVSCILANGIPASLHYAGVRHGNEAEAATRLRRCADAAEGLAVMSALGYVNTWSWRVA